MRYTLPTRAEFRVLAFVSRNDLLTGREVADAGVSTRQAIYQQLHRLERKGLVISERVPREWGMAKRVYEVTDRGRLCVEIGEGA